MRKTSTIIRHIFGDQLDINHSWFQNIDPEITYVMMEVKTEQEYVKHHIQKIIGFFYAMRLFAKQLIDNGHQVIYFQIDDVDNLHSFENNLNQLINNNKVAKLEYQIPDEYRLLLAFENFTHSLKIDYQAFDSEHFYTTKEEFKIFFEGKKTFLMENFYRYMRKKHSILMTENQQPLGDQWNFDHENRKKYDNKNPLKPAILFSRNVSEIKKQIDDAAVDYFGNIDVKDFSMPLTRSDALQQLEYFCQNLLIHFGTYEDAMLDNHQTLFHSKLSFAMNLKLIKAKEVVETVLKYYHVSHNKISISQIEGFVRQVIGWREYMRGLYWMQMPSFKKLNFLENHQSLPSWFWTGNTKMNCVQNCINDTLDQAYAHHIQRLMVIGNIALLSNIDPDEVDHWYLGVYADAVEWVQLPNTRGMSQYADGGLVGSKPYISSANYIDKMSNYCKNCYYDKKLKYGERSCPFNSLYWYFYENKREKLSKNNRISMMYQVLNKMPEEEKKNIFEQAQKYILDIENL